MYTMHCTLLEEDIRLNSQTFNWPAKMNPIFEVCQQRLATNREKTEKAVRDKVVKFEELLAEYQSEVDTYREMEVLCVYSLVCG